MPTVMDIIKSADRSSELSIFTALEKACDQADAEGREHFNDEELEAYLELDRCANDLGMQNLKSKKVKNMDIKDAYGERNEVVKKQRELLELRNGMLGSEDQQKYDRLNARFDELTAIIRQHEGDRDKVDSNMRSLEAKEDMLSRSQHEPVFRQTGSTPARRVLAPEYCTREYNDAVFSLMKRGGHNGLTPSETRTLQVNLDSQGGYLVAGEEFSNRFIAAKEDECFVRKYATQIPLKTAGSLGVPALNAEPEDDTWEHELSGGSEEDTISFAKRQFFPHVCAKYLKVSEQLVRQNPNAVDWILGRLAWKAAVTEERAFLGYTDNDGTGSNQPMGIFNDSVILTSTQDISYGATATTLKGDTFIKAYFDIKPQYRRNCRWLLGSTGLQKARSLKDGNGQYIWMSGIANGKPDTILGLPYDESIYCRDTYTTGKYVGLLIDWSFYWIVDALDMRIKVADQLYLTSNSIGYFLRFETDGMLVLADACRRLKTG